MTAGLSSLTHTGVVCAPPQVTAAAPMTDPLLQEIPLLFSTNTVVENSGNSGNDFYEPDPEPSKVSKFRINRQKIGLTYSRPKNHEGEWSNPIPNCEYLRKHFTEKYGDNKYLVSKEPHEDGSDHYHVYFHFENKLDIKGDPRCFDVLGVHPNICRGSPNKGWHDYIAKHGDFISNFYQRCPYAEAFESANVNDAMKLLIKKRPADVAKHGEQIERNLKKFMTSAYSAPLYYGPFPYVILPEWNPYTHALLLFGEPGTQKTQFARYIMAHNFGDYDYIKGHHEKVKALSGTKPFIHDEVYMLECDKFNPPGNSREITDVENGGTIVCRGSNADIPPGLPRIFISNLEHPFRDPQESVYGRRLIKQKIAC